MRLPRETAEHPIGTLKMRMGATYFLMKRLLKFATEMALHVLAYNRPRTDPAASQDRSGRAAVRHAAPLSLPCGEAHRCPARHEPLDAARSSQNRRDDPGSVGLLARTDRRNPRTYAQGRDIDLRPVGQVRPSAGDGDRDRAVAATDIERDDGREAGSRTTRGLIINGKLIAGLDE